jgi:hypothetical protein
VPTRWRTTVRDQLQNATERAAGARRHLLDGDGSAAIQEAYPAAVTGATIRVWLQLPPWQQALNADTMHRRVHKELPELFAALVQADVQRVLTTPWHADDAQAYVEEVEQFVAQTGQQVSQWLEDS